MVYLYIFYHRLSHRTLFYSAFVLIMWPIHRSRWIFIRWTTLMSWYSSYSSLFVVWDSHRQHLKGQKSCGKLFSPTLQVLAHYSLLSSKLLRHTKQLILRATFRVPERWTPARRKIISMTKLKRPRYKESPCLKPRLVS